MRLLRRLPAQRAAGARRAASPAKCSAASSARGPPASHVLFEGRATRSGQSADRRARARRHRMRIDVAGGSPASRAAIALSSAMAASSLLVDHSHFGTFVNGERVSERARVHAGDRVRLGEPGVELSLISLGADGLSADHMARQAAAASKSSACRSSTASAAASARSSCSTRSSARRAASLRAAAHERSDAPKSTSSKRRCWSARATSWSCATRSRRRRARRRATPRAPRQLVTRARKPARAAVHVRRHEPRAPRAHREAEGRHPLAGGGHAPARRRRDGSRRAGPGDPGFRDTGGDRRYITGLKMRGKRILILVDRSASMLHEDLVNVILLRNSSEAAKRSAAKWRRAHRHRDLARHAAAGRQPVPGLRLQHQSRCRCSPAPAGKWQNADDPLQRSRQPRSA